MSIAGSATKRSRRLVADRRQQVANGLLTACAKGLLAQLRTSNLEVMPDPPPQSRPAGAARTPKASLDHVESCIFDLDNTLYPASCNLFAQVDRRISEFVAAFLQVDAEEAHRL